MSARAIRRKDRAIAESSAWELMERCAYGFLATVGADGLPYGVPLSYVALNGGICFHCAREGRKVDNLKYCRNGAFTVVGGVEAVYAGSFSTYYESAMASGPVAEIADVKEKSGILYALAEKYLPEHLDKAAEAIRASMSRTAVYRLDVAEITGKARLRPAPPE